MADTMKSCLFCMVIDFKGGEIKVIKIELRCDIWVNFPLGSVQSCAVFWKRIGTIDFEKLNRRNRDSVIAILHNAIFLAAYRSALYKLSP